ATRDHGGVVVPWLLSGRTEAALRGQAERLEAHLQVHPEAAVADVGWSLATRRSAFEHRAAVLVGDRTGALDGLAALARGDNAPNLVGGVAAAGVKTAFLFSGQGSQRAGMGRELYQVFGAFAEAFDAACACFDSLLDRPLRDVVFAPEGTVEAGLLDQTGY